MYRMFFIPTQVSWPVLLLPSWKSKLYNRLSFFLWIRRRRNSVITRVDGPVHWILFVVTDERGKVVDHVACVACISVGVSALESRNPSFESRFISHASKIWKSNFEKTPRKRFLRGFGRNYGQRQNVWPCKNWDKSDHPTFATRWWFS